MLNIVHRRLNSTIQTSRRGEQMNFRKQRKPKDNSAQNESSSQGQNETRE
jgi:hypothetical protein